MKLQLWRIALLAAVFVTAHALAAHPREPVTDEVAAEKTGLRLTNAFSLQPGFVFEGELIDRQCLPRPKVCLDAGTKVVVEISPEEGARVSRITSLSALTLFGATWASGKSLSFQSDSDVRGELAVPARVDGLLVQGNVAMSVSKGRLAKVYAGTLVEDAVLDGWRVPAGYDFELQRERELHALRWPSEGQVPPVRRVKQGELPGAPDAIVEFRSSEFDLYVSWWGLSQERVTVGTAILAPGAIEWDAPKRRAPGFPAGTTRTSGRLAEDFEEGSVLVPAGSRVDLVCGRLHAAHSEENARQIRIGKHQTGYLRAHRDEPCAEAQAFQIHLKDEQVGSATGYKWVDARGVRTDGAEQR